MARATPYFEGLKSGAFHRRAQRVLPLPRTILLAPSDPVLETNASQFLEKLGGSRGRRCDIGQGPEWLENSRAEAKQQRRRFLCVNPGR